MYVKVTNGVVEKYPYTTHDLRKENPGISFPETIPQETLASFGVYPVSPVPCPPGSYAKDVVEGMPSKTSQGWSQVWNVVDASAEQVAERTASQISGVRIERDRRLSACDWVVIKEAETGVSNIGAWKDYRQALRDVPQQPGFPWDVAWPQPPK